MRDRWSIIQTSSFCILLIPPFCVLNALRNVCRSVSCRRSLPDRRITVLAIEVSKRGETGASLHVLERSLRLPVNSQIGLEPIINQETGNSDLAEATLVQELPTPMKGELGHDQDVD